MGNRLTKIYTRTGDDGTTGLATGERVAKDCTRVEAFGSVDELNSCIGLVLATANLPVPGRDVILAGDTTALEAVLDELNANLPPLKDFVLPGGTPGAAACHLARAVCRRAERRVITLQRDERVNAEAVRYLNRLSDLLFVMSRVLCRVDGGTEVIWRQRQEP